MRLWKRAAGALKDRNSILAAKLCRHSPCRNPDLETVVIKATSHDEHRIDCKNVKRTFQWLRTSPLYLKPLVYSLSLRMEKTRNWVVALKGLMLIHGVFCCDIPAVQKMGRLPFDLSNFSDGHLHPAKAWAFNAFVRAYFAYLDTRSSFVFSEVKYNNNNNNSRKEAVEEPLMEELEKLQKLQNMIDMLIYIKPRNGNMNNGLILEAMDCIIVEVFDVYAKFCKRIARVLVRIYQAGGKVEAGIALKVLQKAADQGKDLSLYFEYCRDLGVLNASQCPRIERIPEEDIKDLERIITTGGSSKKLLCIEAAAAGGGGDNAVAVRDCSVSQQKELTTVITHQWEVFDDDDSKMMVAAKGGECDYDLSSINGGADSWAIVPTTTTNPFLDSYDYNYSLVPYHHHHLPAVHNPVQLPDLISF